MWPKRKADEEEEEEEEEDDNDETPSNSEVENVCPNYQRP